MNAVRNLSAASCLVSISCGAGDAAPVDAELEPVDVFVPLVSTQAGMASAIIIARRRGLVMTLIFIGLF